MNDASEILNTFKSISLEEMSKVKLLDRMDKKYMLHADQLPEILLLLKNEYFVLEIAQKKFASYETTYFDTDDYEMYTKHHNGKLNRYKVRFRTYADSNLNFFEVKFKTNKGRTKKSRVQLPDNKHLIKGDAEKLLLRKTNYTAAALSPVLEVKYKRITLVNRNMSERITIDIGLKYNHFDTLLDVPNLIIAEVKQEKTSTSVFTSLMQEKRIKTVSLSKYCLGITSTVENVKHNNFKSKIRYVNQLFI